MRFLVPAALSAALTATASPAAAASPAKVAAAKRAVERALHQEKPDALIAARGALDALSAADPKSALLHYWVAYATWRLVPRLPADSKQAERFCKDGLERADRALAVDPKFAEALALKGALQGLWLRFRPGEMMTLGAEIEENMAAATTMAPDNPRVRFLDAVNTLHKPDFVGGGAGRALPKFEATLELFAAESVADSTAPDWGRADAWIWTGRAAMKLGDPARAADAYRKALEIDPENGWVRGSLLPEAEKALEKAKAKPKDES